MDNNNMNNNNMDNPFQLGEGTENNGQASNPGVSQNTNQTGTYDAYAYNTAINQEQSTVTQANEALQNAQEEACAKHAKYSMILGILLNALNLIMMCSMLLGGGFLYGAIFLVLAIVGIQKANLGRQSSKRGMATAGLVLNIVALVFSALFVILGLVLKLFEIIN